MLRKLFRDNNSMPTKKTAYIMITISAILYSIAVNVFYQTAGTFSAGIGSLVGLLTFTNRDLIPFFSVLYLALNIPIILIFWKKVKKSFIFRTTYFLIIQAAFGFIFYIDAVSDAALNILGGNLDIQAKKWPILILPLGGAVIMGFSIAIAYKYGASSGGTDIIVYYFSTKKKIAIGKLAFFVSMSLVLFSFSTTMAINGNSRENWYLTLMGTMVAVAINSTIVDRVYPKYSKRRLDIHSTKPKMVQKKLAEISNHASYTSVIKSNYTGKEKNIIITTVLLLEVKNIRRELLKVDPKIWISDSRVERVFGHFDSSAVE